MTEFDQALTLVHETLAQLQDNASGTISRASLVSLHKLAEVAGALKPAKRVEATPSSHVPPSLAPRSDAPVPARGLAAAARAAMEAAANEAKQSAPVKPILREETVPPAVSKPVQPVQAVVAPVQPFANAHLPKAERMAPLRERALVCTKCPQLVASRTQVVFGVGNIDAELMFVGEAPGADEDIQGEPFVGKAGQLLTKIINAMGFDRDDVYIGNVLKCRPDMPPGESGNRKPRPDEMATCLPYLIEQIDIIQPKCIVALGATAMEGLIGKNDPMAKLRGQWHSFKGIPLLATYHPAYLLRNQSLTEKRKVWEDMMLALELLGRPITAKQRGFFLPKE